MTNEEAIQTLITIDSGYSPNFVINGHIAIDMAIKALSQQTEDAISRQAAIEKIHWLGLDHDTAIKCDLAIRALPPVIPNEPIFFPPCQDCNTKMDEIRRAYDKIKEVPKAESICGRKLEGNG